MWFGRGRKKKLNKPALVTILLVTISEYLGALMGRILGKGNPKADHNSLNIQVFIRSFYCTDDVCED